MLVAPRLSLALVAGLSVASASVAAYASDGVIQINQVRALAGGVTPGDAPGFPVTLSQSGNYGLTGDLTLPDANTDGIVVSASVTSINLDLNGFAIGGPIVCTGDPRIGGLSCNGSGSGAGIRGLGNPGAPIGSIAITNGVVRGTGRGIDIEYAGVSISDVRAFSNAGIGMRISTSREPCVVRDSQATRNDGDGFFSSSPCTVSGFAAHLNSGKGIYVSAGVVRGCVAASNGGDGIRGEQLNASENTAFLNAGVGIDADDNGGLILHNSVYGNSAGGIAAQRGSAVVGNSVSTNGSDGIAHNGIGSVVGNSVTQNLGNGITAGNSTSVIDNTLVANGGTNLVFTNTEPPDGSGYARNVLSTYTEGAGTVSGGTSFGPNLCNGSTTCP